MCNDTGNSVANGTVCGTNQVCDKGTCSACTAGTSCTPANPCDTGLTSCSTGVSACTDTGTHVANGTSCGTNLVCDNGVCKGCTTGAACTPTNPCHVGSTSCTTGTPVCNDTGTNQPNLTSCGSPDVCCIGTCATCSLPANSVASCNGNTCQPQCNSPLSLCSGACVNEATDVNNCGGCGHSCLPGGCSAGQCTAVAIATYQYSGPRNMAIDSGFVYWTESYTGGVYRVAKTGGAVTTIKAHDGVNDSALFVTTDTNSGGNLAFWSDYANGRIGANYATGGGTPWYFTSPNGSGAKTYGIAQQKINTDFVYGADYASNEVWYSAVTYGANPGTNQYATGAGPSGLVDPGTGPLLGVLYTSGDAFNVGNAKVIADGSGSDSAEYITTDGSYAFWTGESSGKIYAAPVGASGASPAVLTGESSPHGIAYDGTYVYWVAQGSGQIRYAAFFDSVGVWSAVNTYVNASANPIDIRVDSTAVYWTDYNGGQIWRLNK